MGEGLSFAHGRRPGPSGRRHEALEFLGPVLDEDKIGRLLGVAACEPPWFDHEEVLAVRCVDFLDLTSRKESGGRIVWLEQHRQIHYDGVAALLVFVLELEQERVLGVGTREHEVRHVGCALAVVAHLLDPQSGGRA